MEYKTLPNGIEIPMLGYGVYQVTPQECEKCVSEALKIGYRHIDTAQAYFNEEGVGAAIEKSGIPRNELFITSKVWIDNFGYEKTRASVLESMRKLRTDYIDLMLLHQPFGDTAGAWRALEDLYDEGKLKAIGISNFYADRMVEHCLFNARIRPMVNQIEIHPYHQQNELLGWMDKYGIVPEAWAPLGEGRDNLFHDETLLAIAAKHGKSLHQVVLRWHIQKGVIVFPMSRNPEHMKDNWNIFDFSLSDEEMAQIASLDKGKSAFFSHQDPAMVEWFGQMVVARRDPSHKNSEERKNW